MDSYVLAEDVEMTATDSPLPVPLVSADVPRFELRKNTKLPKILDALLKQFEKEEVRRALLHGAGDSAAKCVSCAEIFKGAYAKEKVLYQWNVARPSKSRDVWAPIDDERMDRLVVEKNVPEMFVLLSKDPFPDDCQCASQQSSDEKLPTFLDRPIAPSKAPSGASLISGKNQWMRRPKSNKQQQKGPPAAKPKKAKEAKE